MSASTASNSSRKCFSILRTYLKVSSATFLLVCFSSLKSESVKLGKMFFTPLQKLYSFLRKWNFVILFTEISWHHKMSKHKTKKIFTE